MLQSRHTKKVLLSSILSLLVCVAMLIGSTFAWFTDSVKSGNNKIVAGNLDIDLQYSKDMQKWDPVENATTIFDQSAKWEPGYTDVVYLKVSNNGSLALKYQLAVVVADETKGTNQNGEEFKLSDFIKFGQVEDVTAKYADRDDAIQAVNGNALPINNAYAFTSDMQAGAKDKVIALVVYMPKEVGNEANFKTGTNVPTINLSFHLTATQLSSESDGFSNTYDTDALKTSLLKSIKDENEKNVVINSDVVIDSNTERLNVSSDKTIDFSNKKLVRGSGAGNGLLIGEKNYNAFPVTVTINNGQFISESGPCNAVRIESGSNVTFNNCSFKSMYNSSLGDAIQVANSGDGIKNVLRFNNCSFEGIVNLDSMNGPCEYDVEFNNCTFSGTNGSWQSCVEISTYSYGDFKFDNCTINPTYKGNGACAINVNAYSGSNGNNNVNITLKDTSISLSKDVKASSGDYAKIMNVNTKKIINMKLLGNNSFTIDGVSQVYNSEKIDFE